MNQCKICQTPLQSNKAKTCNSKECKNSWKMIRIRNLPEVEKICVNCGIAFETKDKRDNTCSNSCRVEVRHKTMISKYGKKSITSPWESRKEKISKTILEKYNGSSKRHKYLKDRGFNNIEELASAVYTFCKENNIAPNSKKCLEHFNMSTYMNRILTDFGFGDVLHNSYRNSQQEIEIQDFLKSKNMSNLVTNYRPDILKGKELDIFLPDYNIAIEFHGLAHHSERPIFRPSTSNYLNKVKTDHFFKYQECKKHGITLIQIFEDEWRDKREIVESIISNKLKLNNIKIYARKCQIKQLHNSTEFFDRNHISGSCKNLISFGLLYENNLVCALSARKTWNKKYGRNVIEIARFASKLNHTVVGGFSRLLKQLILWSNENGFDKILTYADCRFGEGSVYLKSGFKHLGNTGPNYFYEKRGVRESRFKHRKNNSLEFIEEFGDSERAQNNNQGWYAIYDAGNEIYLLNI